MANQRTLKMIETVIGKLVHLNSTIEGAPLNEAIRHTAYVRDRFQSGGLKNKVKHKRKTI